MLVLLQQSTVFFRFISNVANLLIHDETERINEYRQRLEDGTQKQAPRHSSFSQQFEITSIIIIAQNIYM